jgi:hypothetical protein
MDISEGSAYSQRISKQLLEWALIRGTTFSVYDARDAFMQISDLQLSLALDLLVSNNELVKLEAGRRICLYQAIVRGRKSSKQPLQSLSVNQGHKRKNEVLGLGRSKKTAAHKIVVPPVASAAVVTPIDSLDTSAMSVCQDIMKELTLDYTVDKIGVSEFLDQASVKGVSVEEAEAALATWDKKCRIMLDVEDDGKKVFHLV